MRANDVQEVKVLSPTGMLGTGFPEESLRAGLAMEPDVIGCDSGSTDSGPTDLATGTSHYSEKAYHRDLRLMLAAARSKCIPLIIGSAGGAGADPNLDWTRGILEQVATELGLSFRLAIIHASQDKTYLKRKLAEGKIYPLANAPDFNEKVIDRSLHIVGMMGCEPMIRALEGDADVVLAGRSSDTSIFAAFPIMKGFDPGPVWHAAKILECGAASVENRPAPDCMFTTITRDGFVARAPNPRLRCTPVSVAAHSLYENADPFRMTEPSGVLDIANSKYEQWDNQSVRVTGSRFVPSDQYTIKLEGAELVGYQTLTIAGVRDPVVVDDIDQYLATCEQRIRERVASSHPDACPGSWMLAYRVYGRNGTLGKLEPIKNATPHELGLIIEVTADSQELANSLMGTIRHQTLHQAVPQWTGLVSNIALPYGSTNLIRGPVYQFNMNCVVEPDDPYEMFPIEYVNL